MFNIKYNFFVKIMLNTIPINNMNILTRNVVKLPIYYAVQ